MKTISALLISVLAFVIVAQGGMDDRDFSVVASSSSTGTAVVTVSQVVRGTIEAVYVSCGTSPAVTGTVAFASDEGGTIFSKSCSGSAVYYPRTASHTTAGAAYTWLSSVTNDAVNVSTNAFLTKVVAAGKVTMTWTGATKATTTNNATIKLVVSQ